MEKILNEYLKAHDKVTVHFVDSSELDVISADPVAMPDNMIQFRTSENEDVIVNIDQIIYIE